MINILLQKLPSSKQVNQENQQPSFLLKVINTQQNNQQIYVKQVKNDKSIDIKNERSLILDLKKCISETRRMQEESKNSKKPKQQSLISMFKAHIQEPTAANEKKKELSVKSQNQSKAKSKQIKNLDEKRGKSFQKKRNENSSTLKKEDNMMNHDTNDEEDIMQIDEGSMLSSQQVQDSTLKIGILTKRKHREFEQLRFDSCEGPSNTRIPFLKPRDIKMIEKRNRVIRAQ